MDVLDAKAHLILPTFQGIWRQSTIHRGKTPLQSCQSFIWDRYQRRKDFALLQYDFNLNTGFVLKCLQFEVWRSFVFLLRQGRTCRRELHQILAEDHQLAIVTCDNMQSCSVQRQEPTGRSANRVSVSSKNQVCFPQQKTLVYFAQIFKNQC